MAFKRELGGEFRKSMERGLSEKKAKLTDRGRITSGRT